MEEHTDWLSNAKWTALRAYIELHYSDWQNVLMYLEYIYVFSYIYIHVHVIILMNKEVMNVKKGIRRLFFWGKRSYSIILTSTINQYLYKHLRTKEDWGKTWIIKIIILEFTCHLPLWFVFYILLSCERECPMSHTWRLKHKLGSSFVFLPWDLEIELRLPDQHNTHLQLCSFLPTLTHLSF